MWIWLMYISVYNLASRKHSPCDFLRELHLVQLSYIVGIDCLICHAFSTN